MKTHADGMWPISEGRAASRHGSAGASKAVACSGMVRYAPGRGCGCTSVHPPPATRCLPVSPGLGRRPIEHAMRGPRRSRSREPGTRLSPVGMPTCTGPSLSRLWQKSQTGISSLRRHPVSRRRAASRISFGRSHWRLLLLACCQVAPAHHPAMHVHATVSIGAEGALRRAAETGEIAEAEPYSAPSTVTGEAEPQAPSDRPVGGPRHETAACAIP